MKLALTAYACDMNAGSEPGAGFNFAVAASSIPDTSVTLFTRRLDDRTRNFLLSMPNLELYEVPVRHSKRIPQFSYIVWLVRTQKKLRGLHAARGFDISHHVTYATDWLPSPSLANVPHVWGPVGGSTDTPRSLNARFSRSLRGRELARLLVTGFSRRLVKRWARARVSLIVAQNLDTAREFHKHPLVVVRTNCVVPNLPNRPALPKTATVVGRLIDLKGVHLAIAALATPEMEDWSLKIVGDGPLRPTLESLASRLNVTERVAFVGAVDRKKAMELVSESAVLLHLSAHDAAGWSVAESLTMGVPVVTWQHGGPAELVNNASLGITLGAENSDARDIAGAVVEAAKMIRNPIDTFSKENLLRDLEEWYEVASQK